MDLFAEVNSIGRELGLSSAFITQLQSDIKQYIEQWNKFSPPGEVFHKLNDSESEEHASRYLQDGWHRTERLEKGVGKDVIVPPGRFYWESSVPGRKRPKYEYSYDYRVWVVPN